MQKPPDSIDRKMVPRWRGLGQTPKQELLSATARQAPSITLIDIDEKIAAWRDDQSLWAAAEILETVPFIGRTIHSDEAAAMLLGQSASLPPGLAGLLQRYANETNPEEEGDSEQIGRPEAHRQTIVDLRRLKSLYPKNPILYVELARQYVSLGQLAKAEESFRVALAIAPHNRYVLRSAIRFFLHYGHPERAWAVLAGAPESDPWILAGRITVAEIMGRPQNGIRQARSLLENTAPEQSTELAASIGTLELSAGAFKQARKLFRASAVSPSDNTVAQLRWARDKAGIPFNEELLLTQLSFEARTGQAFVQEEWTSALENVKLWQQDEPFSSRPATIGCFLAAEIVRDFHVAEHISNIALISMPNDALLLNNRAYARINLGNLSGAAEDVLIARQKTQTPASEVCLEATEGCLLYRVGNADQGAEFYRRAVEKAVARKDKLGAQAAYLHWLSEDIRAGAHYESLDAVKELFDGPSVSGTTRAVFQSNLDAAVAFRAEVQRVEAAAMESVANIRLSASTSLRVPSADEVDGWFRW
jgi:tetratricopeptide (TPR) repeat protein